MIPIKKQKEPRGLRNAKRSNKDLKYENESKTGFSQYEKYKEAFLELRTYILEEQGKICCYCQKKIPVVKNENGINLMKTEHFIPKGSKNPNISKKDKEERNSLQLEYSNLLASCMGNSDKKGLNFKDHCDSSKGDKRLKKLPNPVTIRQTNYDQYLKYKVREKQEYVDVIAPNDENEDLKSDIKMLNLNEQNLKIKRFSVWKGLWRAVYNQRKKRLNVSILISILEDYDFTKITEPSNRELNEFCGFITQWFENRFKDELIQARK